MGESSHDLLVVGSGCQIKILAIAHGDSSDCGAPVVAEAELDRGCRIHGIVERSQGHQ